MKKNYFTLLLMLIISINTNAQTFSGIIQNPDFEDTNTLLPFNSGNSGAAIELYTATDASDLNVHQGTQSLKFTSQSSNGNHFISSSYAKDIATGTAGFKVNSEVWIKTTTDATFFIRSRVRYRKGTVNEFSDDRREFTFVANTWQKLSFSHTAANDFDSAAYFIQPQTAATPGLVLYIDNLSSEEIPAATASVEENNSFKFEIFPNPANNLLNIETQEVLKKVEIFNLLGKKVLSANNVSKSIDISSLSKSMYLVKLTSEKGISTKKLVKN
ncbi:T9SS type A sorting domain-containing protein [Polaribacter sp. PL03]|uniref:T9SS type A sorting domain-containing protein n=1 Tax=Polaribacter sp. PL03 TaxID=3088353 RepID=UPI0029CB700E|nr:T9SS type A sorting domain-containing protein [Polaribacter sp. PL03]MDX6747938.1 T9SS type A sorting domain-containing protein [Polaribacter sp. PL03]